MRCIKFIMTNWLPFLFVAVVAVMVMMVYEIGNCGKFHHDHINVWGWGWMSLPHELIILSVSGERNILTVSKFDKLIIFWGLHKMRITFVDR